MLYHEQSEDYRPLFWMSGRPIYANTLVVIVHVAAFIIAGICMSYFSPTAVITALQLNTPDVWQGQVWRLFSYIAFDPDFFAKRSLWFLFSIVLLFLCGREVEQFVGRKTYLKLYAALVLIPAVLLCLVGLLPITPMPFLNCCEVFFGMFIAFATLYPGAMPSMWINLPVSMIAWILLGVFTLINCVLHDYTALFMLWTSSAVGYVGMRMAGAGRGMTWFTDWLENRQAARLAQQHQIKVLKDTKANESIDDILEKISKHGVNSLDAKERAALERARTNLLKRDQR